MVCVDNVNDIVDNGYFRCDNVTLPCGDVYSLYIADSGIFAIVLPVPKLRDFYLSLRDILGTSRLQMYVKDVGLYDLFSDSTGPLLSDDELTELINSRIFSDSPVWDSNRICDFRTRILRTAAFHRGECVDDEGNVFVLRNGKFVSASSKPPERIYFLALFGGSLGLHRFASGKFFSGLLYLFTGGLFLVGWFLDVVALLFGVFKDREGKYLTPPKNRFKGFLWLPAGIIASAALFLVYLRFTSLFLASLNAEMYQQIHQADSFFSSDFQSVASQFLRNIQLYFGD